MRGNFNLESPGLECLYPLSRAWEGSRNQQRGVSHRELFSIRMDWPRDLEERTEEERSRSSYKTESSAPSHFLPQPELFLLGRNGERMEGSLLREGVWAQPTQCDLQTRARHHELNASVWNLRAISHCHGVHTAVSGLIH